MAMVEPHLNPVSFQSKRRLIDTKPNQGEFKMTPSIATTLADRSSTRRETAAKNYRKNIEAAARTNKPSAALVNEIESAALEVGHDAGRVDQDIKLIQQREALKKQVADGDAAQSSWRDVVDELGPQLSISSRIKRRTEFFKNETALQQKYQVATRQISTHHHAIRELERVVADIQQIGEVQ
jgi:hypothetical protein